MDLEAYLGGSYGRRRSLNRVRAQKQGAPTMVGCHQEPPRSQISAHRMGREWQCRPARAFCLIATPHSACPSHQGQLAGVLGVTHPEGDRARLWGHLPTRVRAKCVCIKPHRRRGRQHNGIPPLVVGKVLSQSITFLLHTPFRAPTWRGKRAVPPTSLIGRGYGYVFVQCQSTLAHPSLLTRCVRFGSTMAKHTSVGQNH